MTLASMVGNIEALKVLIAAGADVDKPNKVSAIPPRARIRAALCPARGASPAVGRPPRCR